MKTNFSHGVFRLPVPVFLAGALFARLGELPLCANPGGGTVAQGTASFTSSGSKLTVQTSDRAFINWQSFNIGVGETTTFAQPSSSSVVWNSIHDANPSQILGNLNANGFVVLQNPNGFFIGGQASITAHGLLMTTARTPLPDPSLSSAWQFSAPPPTARIINYGQIQADKGGSVFLLSHEIENHGKISAPEGNIGLVAGQDVFISTRPDGRGLSAQVTLPVGSVNNQGQLIADAGKIAMQARVVNQGGLVQANSAREVNGVIELLAGDAIHLEAASVIQANGDDGVSSGGSITVKSDGSFSDESGSAINIAGGLQGGNGGSVEISAPNMSTINSDINGEAASGFVKGKLTIDPLNILLVSSGGNGTADQYANGVVNPGDPPTAGTLTLNVNSFSKTLSEINLQAVNDITLGAVWTLTDPGAPASLTLSAGNNIILRNASAIKAARNWSVNLFAGTEAGSLSETVSGLARWRGIYLDGNSSIQTFNGFINVWAANQVIINPGGTDPLSTGPVGSGTTWNGIRTTGGGNIIVTALSGDVNAGGNYNAYVFGQNAAPYYRVNIPILGGISTAAGGDVTITAGGNVSSLLPLQNNYLQARGDGGVGAFGVDPGNVTITAGGNVSGHYVVANGNGKISAGNNIGGPTASGGFALSLVKGNWDVRANGRMYVQDIRNPNGIFNDSGGSPQTYAGYHYFDYDPFASVRLEAGQSIEITGAGAPHAPPSSTFKTIPLIFPPSLEMIAGAGGIKLDIAGSENPLVLFRSPYSDLHITTFNGGNFEGVNSRLVMSGSSARQWDPSPTAEGSFLAEDQAATSLQWNNPDPVEINISGSIRNLTLYTSKQTRIKVGGDMFNANLFGVNLHAGDETSIDVAGSIRFSPLYSFVQLAEAINRVSPRYSSWEAIFSLLVDPTRVTSESVRNPTGTTTELIAQATLLKAFATPAAYGTLDSGANPGFYYDASSQQLGFRYQMSQQTLSALSGPLLVIQLDPTGRPIIQQGDVNLGQDPEKFYFATTPVSFAPPSQIQNLYAASQNSVSKADSETLAPGYIVGGPGTLRINAGSIDLGSSGGIISAGVGMGLQSVSLGSGASINVTVAGDLKMITSTIATYNGGSVSVNSGGSITLSEANFFLPSGTDSQKPAFGIFTSRNSDVSVAANSDINVGSARIAAFDGGDVLVRSENGDVNAGNGANVVLNILATILDPTTGLLKNVGISPRPFGSGIMAISVGQSGQQGPLVPGDITVETPHGDIVSTLGGISQFVLNGTVGSGPLVKLTAGTPASDGSPAFAGNVNLGSGGVLGGTIDITAQGSINGLIVSRENSTVNAAQSFSGTVLSGGTANVTATGGGISGTIIGVAGVNASGAGGVTASLLSQNVSVGGGAAQSTLGPSASATSTSTAAAGQASSDAKEQVASNDHEDDDKKRNKGPVLRRVGRVTVILPPA